MSAWIWCRALGEEGSTVDLTPFLNSMTTNVDSNGGNFSLAMTAIKVIKDDTGNWQVDTSQISQFSDDQYFSSIFVDLNNTYLHNIIQQNDVVFLRFEKLKNESERIDAFNSKSFTIDKTQLPSLPNNRKSYDMLGLIDKATENINYSTSDVNVSISGRDFIKLLIDDGSFFYPLQFAQNAFANEQEDKKLIQRLALDGSFILTSSMAFRSIAFTLQFLINHISNLGIVPQQLLSAYDNSQYGRSKLYRLDTQTPNNQFNETLANGLWQIIKLVIDENVADRRVADVSISMPDGSLLNQIHKVCQSPFVEFFTDTYGDQFNLVVRKPPFDGNSIQAMLNNIAKYENTIIPVKNEDGDLISSQTLVRVRSKSDLIQTIYAHDVISIDNVSNNTDDIYSLYEIKPQGLFIGQGSEVSLAYVPLIYFAPYANVWGAKRLSVVSNYLPFSGLTGSTQDRTRSYISEQCAIDLKYLIDCYAYMPFTRNMSITINGDRRFKYGTWVRIESTGEIGYVTQVQNSSSIGVGSIDRTTTIQLTRVMVEKYCHPPLEDKSAISYFNIIDSELVYRYVMSNLTSNNNTNSPDSQQQLGVQIKQNFAVNQDVFDFFLKRKQFD
jgi:hypothetical protein